jgi:hypothetical protein
MLTGRESDESEGTVAMDEAEREAAERMLGEENDRLRKYFRHRAARRKPLTPEALGRVQAAIDRHRKVVEMIREYREAHLKARSAE